MKRHVALLKNCHGSVTVMTLIMMFVFVGLLAFIIDLAHVQTVKTELSNAADNCALRGARAFLPDNIPTTSYSKVDPNPGNAKIQAQNAISDNKSDNMAFQVGDLPTTDIQVGIWDFVNKKLMDWQWPPDSSYWGKYIGPGISLPTKRNSSTSLGSVGMTLANIFGISAVPVNAMATAAISGPGVLPKGYPGGFPIAVDEDKVHAAGEIIFMSPDVPDVGGWTSMSLDPASANQFKQLISDPTTRPELKDGDTIALQNGVACSAIKEAIKTYNAQETETKGVYKLDPPVYVVFPVVEVDKFNQTADVMGFMAANIKYFRDSNAPNDILIPGSEPPKYTGSCMIVLEAVEGNAGGLPGGGRWYGVLSPYPKLVQ